eukprot:11227228-Alexandrium_andersonii.AAC.1
MLDGVHAPRAHSPADGLPGQEAAREVSVDVSGESGPTVLPREVVDAPRAYGQVADQSDQRCPVSGRRGRHPTAALLSSKPQVRAV